MIAAFVEFEPPDLAGWLWAAFGVAVVAEAARYVWYGHRPATRRSRAILVGVSAAVAAPAILSDALFPTAPHHAWACFGLGVVSILWLVRSYRRTTRPIANAVRLTLLGMRIALAVVIVLILADPVLKSTEIRREPAVLAILLDDSRSMQVKDIIEAGGEQARSRREVVNAQLDQDRSALRRLTDEMEVRWFRFDEEVASTDDGQITARGDRTAVGDALNYVHAALGQSGRRIAGVVLISDGRDNFSRQAEPSVAARALNDDGVALFTVGVGSDVPVAETSTLQARRLDCPDRVSALNRFDIRAEFVAAGLRGEPVELELQVDGETVARRDFRPDSMRALVPAEFAHELERGGLHRIAVRAKAPSIAGPRGEAEVAQFVVVSDEKIRVLYIDRARYERAAIARALEAAKELRLRKLDPDQGAFASADAGQASSWKTYQVVLIGDVAPNALAQPALRSLREHVLEGGAGLGVLGGVRGLGTGRYEGTPLAGLLPIDPGAVGQIAGPLAFLLTPAGQAHAICQLAETSDENRALWSALPAMAGASRLGTIPPAAEILMVTARGDALLTAREAGRGRTVAVAFDSTWQWAFAHDQGADVQRRFWRQLVLWLANRQPAVWVAPERPRYELADLRSDKATVVLEAGVTSPLTGDRPDGVTLEGDLTRPDGTTQSLGWVAGAEAFASEPAIDQAGAYRVRVRALAGDAAVGEAEAAFVVTDTDLEMLNAIADLDAMRELATLTRAAGGRYLPVQELGALWNDIETAGHVTEIQQIKRTRLVDEWVWFWFTVFLLVIATEWVVRKRLGLV